MNSKSLLIMLSLIFISPCHAGNIVEYRKQLAKSSRLIKLELEKINREIGRLDSNSRAQLTSTYIGDESMTEMDILILGNDMVSSGVEKYDYYFSHLGKRMRKDAVGGQYK